MSEVKKLRRRIAIFGLPALVLACVVVAAIGIGLCEFALHPARPPSSRLAAPWHELQLTAADGAKLRAWYARAADPSPGTVLVVHGVAANGAAMRGLGDFLLARGYHVLMPDLRAHGHSEGSLATYGVLEVDDLRRWAGLAAARADSGACLFGLGESMGAAILLETLPAEPRLCAAVAESSFVDFRTIAHDRVSQKLGLEPAGPRLLFAPVVSAGFLYARLRYGIDLEAVSPARGAAASSTAVLLIHGPQDRNIPLRHSLAIAEERRRRQPARPAEIWEVPRAGHTAAHATLPREFEDRVDRFFRAAARLSSPAAPDSGSP